MEYFFTCPYCWQEISVIIDISAESQSYVEDCEVCCNPIMIRYTLQSGEVLNFEAEKNQ